MMTFHIIETTQLHGGTDVDRFEDSVHRRYRFVSKESNICAKPGTKSDVNLETDSISDDVFITSKPLYVCFVHFANHSHRFLACNT